MKNQIARKMTKSEAYKKVMELESENTRLKALLKDAQELIHAPTGDPFEYKLKYDAFQVKLKREGI